MKISFKKHYGASLRAKRKVNKITQEYVANKAGLTDKAVREIENSAAECKILNYCNSLDIDYSEIFDFSFSDSRSETLFNLIVEIENDHFLRKKEKL